MKTLKCTKYFIPFLFLISIQNIVLSQTPCIYKDIELTQSLMENTNTIANHTVNLMPGFNTEGFTYTADVQVGYGLPVINIASSDNTYCGVPINLTASGASVYTWAPSEGLSSTNGNSVQASPAILTTYIVTGTDANNCSNTASIVINVCSTFNITINTKDVGSGYIYTVNGDNIVSKQYTTGGLDTIVIYNGSFTSTDLFLHINSGAANAASDLKFNIHKQNGISNVQILNEGIYSQLSSDFYSITDNSNLIINPKQSMYTNANGIIIALKDGLLLTPTISGSFDLLRINGLESIDQFRIRIYNLSDVLVFDTTNKTNYWDGKDMNTNILVPKGVYKYIIEADDKTLAGQFIVDYQ